MSKRASRSRTNAERERIAKRARTTPLPPKPREKPLAEVMAEERVQQRIASRRRALAREAPEPPKPVKLPPPVDNATNAFQQALATNNRARAIYEQGNPTQKEIIERIFLGDYIQRRITERCGREGFRIFFPWTNKEEKLSGADRVLSNVVWGKNLKPKKLPASLTTKKSATVRFTDGRTYFGQDGGRVRGETVHTEVDHFVRWEPARFRCAHEVVDPMTVKILECIMNQGLRIFDSERIVVDKDLRIGTAIDVLAFDKRTNELVAIEVKTGYRDTFTLGDGNNRYMPFEPFTREENSPLNRAMFQILLGALLAERSFGISVQRCGVVNIQETHGTAVFTEMPAKFRHQYGPVLFDAIQNWRRRQEEAKRNKSHDSRTMSTATSASGTSSFSTSSRNSEDSDMMDLVDPSTGSTTSSATPTTRARMNFTRLVVGDF